MEKTEIVMTTEEKAKAYDEALGHARQAYGTGAYDDQTLEAIFPQLCESEDERIRKHLIAIVEMYWGKTNDPDKAKELAYLKKQKEPHYTKRNTLFDKCVAQCDPAIMKKVSDKIDEMLQKEQNWNKKPCLTCQEYEKGHKQGYTEGCTVGYNKAMKEIEQKEQDLAEMAQSKSPLSVAYANRCFENGKQAMKEQMLKDAVEGYVDKDHIVTEGPFYYIRSRNLDLPNRLKEGDKVHIVVLKEEEE